MKKSSAWISIALTGSLITGGAVYATTYKSDKHGVITRVVDGDTVDMTIAGTQTRVRLLNIDTPETVDPSKAVECLGPEASEHLESLLQPGDKVELQYDVEREDQYGRTLAAVYKDDEFINRSIAAAGLGIAVKYEPNTKFYDEVLAGQLEAEAQTSGLFSPEVSCAIPSQVGNALTELDQIPSEAATTIEEAESMAADAAAAAAAGLLVSKSLKSLTPDTHPVTYALLAKKFPNALRKLDSSVQKAQDLEGQHSERHRELVKEEKERKKKEAEAKAKREAEKKAKREAQEAAERQAAQQAAERRAAERRATERRAAERRSTPKPRTTTPRRIEPKRPSVPKNYTGPRCYAPGGKTWKPCG